MHAYYVYILTNVSRNVMYVGVTNDLERRIADHGDGRGGSFTRRYRVNTLVHVEEFQYIDEAIGREKLDKRLEPRQKGRSCSGVEPDMG
jgi:putative endonuclease